MKLTSYLNLAFLLIVLLCSCKKEGTSSSCDENYNEVDPSKINRKVLVIGIDGFREDVLTASNAPFLNAFAQEPTSYFTRKHKVEYYTSSGPNWTSLLTGVHHEKHLTIDNFFSLYEPTDHPPFFYYIETADASINTVSICHWLPINGVIVTSYADFAPIAVYSDSAVYEDALGIITQTSVVQGDVIFLHFDDLDHFGHAHGYHDTIPEYVQAVNTIDSYAEGLINAVNDRRALGEDWAIFIVSDHGGEAREHTGMPTIETVNETIFFANHPSESFRNDYITSQADLAPSVLSFLGIENGDFECKKDGNSIFE